MSEPIVCGDATLERVARVLGPQCEAAKVLRLMQSLRGEGKRPRCLFTAYGYLVVHDSHESDAPPATLLNVETKEPEL